MRDLETKQVTKLPERIATAQRNASVSDEGLCQLMGWRLIDLVTIKAGERLPSPSEMRALYGVFGKNRQGVLQSHWPDGEGPPLKPADWVILGDQAEITEADRLMVENRKLRQRIEELEAQLAAYQTLETSVAAMTRKLARRS